jgi:hypothetical protein
MGARLAFSLIGTIPVALLSSIVTVIGNNMEVHDLHHLRVPGLLHRAVVAPTNLVVLSSRPAPRGAVAVAVSVGRKDEDGGDCVLASQWWQWRRR